MSFQVPESMEECLYFTNRDQVIAWVYRQECPQCHKAKMGKPINKQGVVKIKAKEYQCPLCRYTEDKETHEARMHIEAIYTCPKCGKKGETTAEYKRKNYQGIPSFIIICKSCGEKIPLTKKLKGMGKGEKD